MKTALEELFGDMLTNGWATESTGDVEAPTGYFGRLHNATEELGEIRDAFSDTIDAYGDPVDDEIVGDFIVIRDSQGFIHITRYNNASETIDVFNAISEQYYAWDDE